MELNYERFYTYRCERMLDIEKPSFSFEQVSYYIIFQLFYVYTSF